MLFNTHGKIQTERQSEFEIVQDFSHKLGLPNKTDGSLFIYKAKKGTATKPDGYYFYEGITFILDAKSPNAKFSGQLQDYMHLESNENFIGFEYNKKEFRCYVNGKLQDDELLPRDKEYYRLKYFPKKINNEIVVNKSAKKLANLFRDSKIDKQMNVPFIGVVFLCMKFGEDIDLTSTGTILNTIKMGINAVLDDNNINIVKKQKKEFIFRMLGDSSLKTARDEDVYRIIQEIATIYNFINISADDYKGHDIMNNFLRVFRRWNSANANEKGEVFTPDHIANLMYKLAHCTKHNTILDPTCGSGTFLTNAMANMFSEIDKNEDLHEAQKNIKECHLIGIEANEFNVTLAGINMLLHGDGSSNIHYDDCFNALKRFGNTYDRVLMNPPFSQNEIELKFVYEALKGMRKGGYLASILPKSCVKGTISANVEYLEKIFDIAKLEAVVSLPRNLFYPVGADTCIIVLHKMNNSAQNESLLINCLEDGFVVANETRSEVEGKWQQIENEVLNAYLHGAYSEFRALKRILTSQDELLFEAYSSHRPIDIEKKVFDRYIREAISAKILCNMPLCHKNLNVNPKEAVLFNRFAISALIEKISKGSEKSIDRTLENKYENGVPLVVAKKDNNGIGGLKQNPNKTYSDKICIVSGGDGGGGKTYYYDFEFCATSFIMVCDFKEHLKLKLDKYAKYYIAIVISERLYKTVGHGRTISNVPSEIDIKLPVDDKGEIDCAYMSNYIKSLTFAEYL